MTLVFRADDGSVLFNGNPMSMDAAKAVRDVLRASALDLGASETVANTFWDLATQVRAAITEAVEQSTATRSAKVLPFRPAQRPDLQPTPPSAA